MNPALTYWPIVWIFLIFAVTAKKKKNRQTKEEGSMKRQKF